MKDRLYKVLILALCILTLLNFSTISWAEDSVETQEQASVAEAAAETQDEEQNIEFKPAEAKEDGSAVVWKAKSGKTTIQVTGDADALPENAVLSVEKITKQEAAEAVAKRAIKEKFSIKDMQVYDISFSVDGKEVQPTKPVQVSIDAEGFTAKKNQSAVYHIGEKKSTEKMDSKVSKDGEVVFEAPHFSEYAIVNQGNNEVKVTIHHLSASYPNDKIYADDYKTLPVGGKINDYKKPQNWKIDGVRVSGPGYTSPYQDFHLESSMQNIEVTGDTEISVYYVPEETTTNMDTTFYDYTVKMTGNSHEVRDDWGRWNTTDYSINDRSMYDDRPSRTHNGNLAIGSYHQNANYNKYEIYADTEKNNGDSLKINDWIGGNDSKYSDGKHPVKGILDRVDVNTGEVIFNYKDPGLFTENDLDRFKVETWQGTKYLKNIYKDYKLGFDQKGDTYTLHKVTKNNTDTWNSDWTKPGGKWYDYSVGTNSGSNNKEGGMFFPLDGEAARTDEQMHANDAVNRGQSGDQPNKPVHNYYFGMRYDFEFSIGDYVGPMEYKFAGDDDLWVCLDGEVILDLGGIHTDCADEVDIWDVLAKRGINKNSLTESQKNETHRITVLYMERGAMYSNCEMEFTIPNAKSVDVQKVPLTDLNIKKVDEKNHNTTLKGATFKLYDNSGKNIDTKITGDDGNVTFRNLKEGVYTLKETSAPDGYVPAAHDWTVNVHKVSGSSDKLVAEVSGDNSYTIGDSSYGITNEKPTPWKIQKVNKNDTSTKLEGAEFTLEGAKTYYGKSGADGYVTWFTNEARTEKLSRVPAGTYTMKETKAPSGYALNDATWTVEITAKGVKSIKEGDKDITASTLSDGTQVYQFGDEMLYELPSTGGSGIYLYSIMGTLLMIAGAVVLFRKRRWNESAR